MNERVKAILSTAFKLSPEERQELARALIETLDGEHAGALDDSPPEEDLSSAGETAQQPACDVLARYLET